MDKGKAVGKIKRIKEGIGWKRIKLIKATDGEE